MIEIILLVVLTRKIGGIVEEKGRKTFPFKLMTVLFWIGGEIIGAVIGAVIVAGTNSSEALIYLFAIIGAAIGAGIAFVIAKSVSPLQFTPPPAPPTFT